MDATVPTLRVAIQGPEAWRVGMFSPAGGLRYSRGKVAVLCVVGVSPNLGPVTLAGGIGLCGVAWAGIYREIFPSCSRGE